MKPVALNAVFGKTPWNGKHPCDPGHCSMEGGVKACHLRQFGVAHPHRMDQFNLKGKVIRVIGSDAMQFLEQLRCDPLGLRVSHAVHHPMPHGRHETEKRLGLEPIQQIANSLAVIGCSKTARQRMPLPGQRYGQIGAA